MSRKNMVDSKRTYVAVLLLLFAVLSIAAVSLPVKARTAEEPAVPVGYVSIFPDLTFDLPVAIVNAGDDRLFIAEQPGRIWAVEGKGAKAQKTLFLDLVDQVQDGCERGLMGLAFHPDYARNGYFYVNYITRSDEKDYTRLSRFQLSADPHRADPASEQILLEVFQPYCNHNGGDVHFDPQGMLVTALGDGGSGGDPHQNSQDPQSYLGKMLRIDIDRVENGKNYAIPADNPFVGGDSLDEIWTLGLRNPWRFSFDRMTGDLYIADVGQREWEEINYVPSAGIGGQNFEWSIKEGFVDYNPNQDVGPGVLTPPINVYGHDQGRCSVTGGYVYRGSLMSELDGVYVYGDYCDGQIRGLVRDGNDKWDSRLLTPSFRHLSAFGEDAAGELYFAIRSHGNFDDHEKGKIYQLQHAWQQLIPVVIAPG